MPSSTYSTGHHFTKTFAEAAAVSMKTGMDNECADFFTKAKDNPDYKPYVDAVKQGLMTEKDIDTSLTRLFTARIRLGMFDPPEMVQYAQTPDSEIDSAPHRELALKIARESIVLFKNDGTLPLKAADKEDSGYRTAGGIHAVLHGNYGGTASHATTALEGNRKQFGAEVAFTPGMNFLRVETVSRVPRCTLRMGSLV